MVSYFGALVTVPSVPVYWPYCDDAALQYYRPKRAAHKQPRPITVKRYPKRTSIIGGR